MSLSKPVELFDWLVSANNVRGSIKPADVKNQSWPWMYDSARPVAFNPTSRVVKLEDGTQYVLPAKLGSKVLNGVLKKQGEQVLSSLPLVYNGHLKPFRDRDVFCNVMDEADEALKNQIQ